MNTRTTSTALRALALPVGLVAVLLAASRDVSASAVEDPIDATRATLEKWVETRQLISQERREWAEGKEVMEARIELVRLEIDGLRAKVADAESNLTDADTKRDELVAERDAVKEAVTAVADAVEGLEARTRALLPRLPQPLQEKVKILGQRLPLEGAETKQSLSERYLNVLGILNEVDKFNREVTVAIEQRELADGTAVEVSTLYLGVGQAYYVSDSGEVAGTGVPAEDGWRWRAANELAPVITKAIDVYNNAEPAAFVLLPVTIQ